LTSTTPQVLGHFFKFTNTIAKPATGNMTLFLLYCLLTESCTAARVQRQKKKNSLPQNGTSKRERYLTIEVHSQSNYPQLLNTPLQLPEMKAPFNVASSIQSTIKLAKFFPSGQLMG